MNTPATSSLFPAPTAPVAPLVTPAVSAVKSTRYQRPLVSVVGVFLLALAALFSGGKALAGEPVAKSRLSGVAIGGHDTVAYHSLEKDPQADAQPGEKLYTVTWKDAKWRFLSQESADRFAADPEKFSPAFNGHCANALSLGEGLIRTDGTHWEIFGDQLYLFYAARGRNRWLATDDVSQYIAEATAAWNELK